MRDYSHCLEVKPSTIHGVGVFSTSNIPSGMCLGSFTGTLLIKDMRYCIERIHPENGMKYWIEGTGTLRYVNHSSTPNSALKNTELIAIREIKAGEEITWDYGQQFNQLHTGLLIKRWYYWLKLTSKKRIKSLFFGN